MSITLKTKSFKPVLSAVSKATSPRSTLPVLQAIHFRLDVDAGGVILAATDLESAISVLHRDLKIGDEQRDFSACVPAAPFLGLVGIAADEIVLDYDPQTRSMRLKSGGSKAELKCLDGDDFPALPANNSVDLGRLTAQDLAEGLKSVSFAMSHDQARPALMATEFSLREGEIYLAAADGFRLAMYKPEPGLRLPEGKPSLVMPRSSVLKLAAALPDDETPVTVEYLDDRFLQFSWNDVIFRSLLAADRFPDWMAILPKDFRHEVEVPREQLAGAIKRAELFSNDGAKAVFLKQGLGGKLTLEGHSEETGSSETFFETVEMTMEGIAFNVTFLRQVVEAFSASSLHVRLNTEKSPTMVSNGTDKFRCIIMPLLIADPAAVQAANAAAEKVAAAEGEA